MDALLLTDLQYDFLPGGALAVPEGDDVIRVANRLIGRFDLTVASQDWHPADHLSFASQHAGHAVGDQITLDDLPQILWPDHCVKGSHGAELSTDLRLDGIDQVIHKGTERTIDSYSCFFDNGHRQATRLEPYLREHNVKSLFIMGLATDYCVKYTALDAVKLGFTTHLVLDGCRGVELQPGDVEEAIEQMQQAGVQIVMCKELTHE